MWPFPLAALPPHMALPLQDLWASQAPETGRALGDGHSWARVGTVFPALGIHLLLISVGSLQPALDVCLSLFLWWVLGRSGMAWAPHSWAVALLSHASPWHQGAWGLG